jgi:protein phosphatase PTC2/3
MSRALGDFELKQADTKGPEDQAVTALSEVINHQISEEDEFLNLACDGSCWCTLPFTTYRRNYTPILYSVVGIWDCLTSQKVVDIVRFQVSEGKRLSGISEFIFDHCLSPDTNGGHGTGQDNMTMVLVALLRNCTKKEWYAWITNGVKKGYGYKTPSELLQLYSPQRLASFEAKKESLEARKELFKASQEFLEQEGESESDEHPKETNSKKRSLGTMVNWMVTRVEVRKMKEVKKEGSRKEINQTRASRRWSGKG